MLLCSVSWAGQHTLVTRVEIDMGPKQNVTDKRGTGGGGGGGGGIKMKIVLNSF